MKRKFKDGYYCTFDCKSSFDGRVSVACGYAHYPSNLRHIADSGFAKTQCGEEILDIRFYSPDHKKVTMEEATEVVKEKKGGWVNIYPDSMCGGIVFTNKENADNACGSDRIDCVQIEWFE